MPMTRSNTKEEICLKALELFSAKGFDGTSLSDISSELGLSKAALFKHYDSKDEILSSIVAMMDEEDGKRAKERCVPEHTKEEDGKEYEKIEKENFLSFALSQFEYWTMDKKAKEYRRLLSLERFKREELKRKWDDNFVKGPLCYTKDIFESFNVKEAEIKAMRLWGVMFLSYSLFDMGEDEGKLKEGIEKEMRDILEERNGIQEKCEI